MANRLDIIVSAVDRNAAATLRAVGAEARTLTSDVEKLSVRSEAYNRIGRTMLTGAAGIAGALGYASMQAMKFEQNLRNVNTITQLNEAGFQGLKAAVLDIARDPKVLDTPQKLSEALYDIESRGFKGQRGLDALRIASMGATAGMTDAKTAATVLTSTMMAYGKTTKEEGIDVMDQLFRLVQLAAPTFDDIAGNYANAAVAAAQLGVPLNELNAAYATMTNVGHSAAITNVALTRLMTTFMDPSKKLLAVMKEQGYESGIQIMRTKGLAGAVEWLVQATGGEQDEMVQLLGEMRAVRAVMALTGIGAQEFAGNLKEQANYTGAFGKALDEQLRGPLAKWRQMVKELNIELIAFGETALPPIIVGIHAATAALRAFGSLPAPVKGLIVWAAGLSAGVLGIMGAVNLARGTVWRFIADWKILRGVATEAAATTAAAAVETAVAGAVAGAGAGAVGQRLLPSAFSAMPTFARGPAAARGFGQAALGAGGETGLMAATGVAMVPYDAAFARVSAMRARWTSAWRGMAAESGGGARVMSASVRNVGTSIWELSPILRALKASWGPMWANTIAGSASILSKAGWVTIGARIATGFRGALTAVKAFGSGLLSFLISPAGIAVAAVAGLAYEVDTLYGAWKTMRAAIDEAKANEAQAAAAQKESQDAGYINEGQVARRMGFTQEQFDAGLSQADSQRVHAEFLRLRQTRRQEWRAAAQGAAEQQQAAGVLGLITGQGGGSGPAAAQGAGQYGVGEEALQAARTQAYMDYRRTSGGVAGAQENLLYTQQQAAKEMEAARATGDADKIAKAQEKSARDIAAAEMQVREASDQAARDGATGLKQSNNTAAGGADAWRTDKGMGSTSQAPVMRDERVSVAAGGQYGQGFSFTIFANSKDEVLKIVEGKLDEAFP